MTKLQLQPESSVQLHNMLTNCTQFREIVESSLSLTIALKCDQHIDNAVEVLNSPLNVSKKHRLKPDKDTSIKEKIKTKRKQEKRNPFTKTRLNKATK